MNTRASSHASSCGYLENLEPRLLLSAVVPSLGDAGQNDGGSAYVASASYGATPTLGSATPLTPTVVDTVTAQGVVRKIYVFGTRAYAVGDAGVQIANIGNPDSPVVQSNISTSASVTSITVANNYLYVGEAGGTLAIYDISDATKPTLASENTYAGITTIQGMAYMDNGSGASPKRLYMACVDAGVAVLDVTAPANPQPLGGGSNGADVMDVAFVGPGTGGWNDNALAVIMGDRVYLMNLSNPDNPTTGSSAKYSAPYDLFSDGYKLYITDSKGLHLVDATSFLHPHESGSVAASPAAQPPGSVVWAAGQVAYFNQVAVGVEIIDTGAIGGPAVIGTYADTSALGVAAYGSMLYVANGDSTWDVVDTGITTRDLTVSNVGSGAYYISPNKKFNVNVSINNLGNLTAPAGQNMQITAYLSADGTLGSSAIQLSPVAYNNTAIAPLSSLAKTLSVRAPSATPEGFYYLILKLSKGGDADSILTNNIWISPDASVQVMKGKPVVTMTLDDSSDSGFKGDNITNISPVSFSGTTRPDCTLTLKRGRTVLGATTSALDGSFSFADVALITGKNSLSVTAVDRAGNSGKLSEKIYLDISVSTSSLILDRSTDSGIRGDFLTSINPVKLTGKTEKYSAVTLLVNSVLVFSSTASSRGAFVFTGVTLADGANDVTVQITDIADNLLSITKTITID